MPPHVTQYAAVGYVMVYDTAYLSDDEIRQRCNAWPGAPVERIDRCPACQQWTTEKGKLRNIDCPAVKAALLGKKRKTP